MHKGHCHHQLGAGKTVLVIEDDYKTASLISLYLSNEGARVVIAGDGKTGLELALSLRPAVIVLDRMLPEMDGLSVCKEIRESLNVPIIFLSARGEEDDRISDLGHGADDYITKPFSLKEFRLETPPAVTRKMASLRM